METATVLIKKINRNTHKDEFKYYQLEIENEFYPAKGTAALHTLRKEIENLYRKLSGEDFVMAKFDKIEKFFDQ